MATKRKRAACPHPEERRFTWFARDDRAPKTRLVPKGGEVLCIACCDCGAVLQGGV